MEETIMTHYFGNSPKVKILEMLIIGRGLDYSITDMAEHGETSRSSIYLLLDEMLKEKIIIETRKLGRMRLFKLNEENPSIKIIMELVSKLVKIENEKEIKRQHMLIKAKHK
jgi:DNA-binding transcriptional ArsR family regulator